MHAGPPPSHDRALLRAVVLVAAAGCGATQESEPEPIRHVAAAAPSFHCVAYTSMPGSWCLPTLKGCNTARDLILAGMPETERAMQPCSGADHAYCFAHTVGNGSTKDHCSITQEDCERERRSGNLPATGACRFVRQPSP